MQRSLLSYPPVKGRVQTLPGRYDAFYQGMVETIAHGKAVPVLPEEGRNTIRVIEAARRSHEEQRTISF